MKTTMLVAYLFFSGVSYGNSVSDHSRTTYFAFVLDGAGSMLYRTTSGKTRDAFRDKLAEIRTFARECRECVVDVIALGQRTNTRRRLTLQRYVEGESKGPTSFRIRPAELATSLDARLPRIPQRPVRATFNYFGHRPSVTIGTSNRFLALSDLAGAYRVIERLTGRSLDLKILSTCNSSTPSFLAEFATSTHIIASATPIHISMFPVLGLLDRTGEPMMIAEGIFQQLKERSSTELAVTLLRGDRLGPVLRLAELPEVDERHAEATSFSDCDDENLGAMTRVFFRRARFTISERTVHTGLACPSGG